ncbi:MAG: dimethylmenaquinone methyltransferase [Chloroflexi bacterium]|nr:dimethylmenaquinone methyltransferase [Chloroflexota bacterium]MBK90358.1 dimethylmenaquinone methyltransferase [Chloroflexota bacterium]|tara:strand:- start:2511 stop:3317 length:807 start_codon:yes stop_codon:yes gene_type:complete
MKLTNPEIIKSITSSWNGDRDKNLRPLVPKDLIERMKLVTTEEAWGTCRKNGYHFQFAGNWNNLHPDRVIVGRAVTCRWVPKRPDLNEAIEKQGKEEKRIGFQNSWVIDELVNDDLIVVDLFGKVFDGTFAGDNLTTAIKSKTGTGMVIDGGIRDTQRIYEMEDFNAFVRGFDPSAINDVSMPEINGIIRIGEATCIPGDVVLGTKSGVIFIPPHLVEEVVLSSENVRLKDEFGQQRIMEGKYTPGEVDREFSDEMNRDFENWKKNRK